MLVSARKSRGCAGRLTWEEVAVDVCDLRCADLVVARDEIGVDVSAALVSC